MDLGPTQRKFIFHWGEMGTRWGINRTVAQIHALLYISRDPLNAEQIAETLRVARSNVSTSLKELQSWGIVQRAPVLGERRDHYESMGDVWEMFDRILEERKRREFDPTLRVLGKCLEEARAKGDTHLADRVGALHEFFETMTGWYTQMRRVPRGTLKSFFKMGTQVKKFLGLAS